MNPLLDVFNAAEARKTTSDERARAIAKYAFAIPTDEALNEVVACSRAGVVEIGAGTGYWAHMLADRGVDVQAFDVEPAPSRGSAWFAGTEPWHPVQCADHGIASQFPERTLLISWPTKNDIWASAAVEHYHAAGGECVVFVGEVGGGGRTGDEAFHARLGELGGCLQCIYGVLASSCTCDIMPLWTRCAMVILPHWPGYDDNLYVYKRSGPDLGASRRSRCWSQRRDRASERSS